MIEIPLTSSPEQLFSITLGEETYDVRVALNSRTKQWAITFSQDGEHVINGIELVGGIDLLDQYNLPISDMYMVNLDNHHLDPSVDNLGTSARLFLLSEEDVLATEAPANG